MDKNLRNRTLPELEQLVTDLGGKAYWAKYLFSFLHAKHTQELAAITPLPKAFRETLIKEGYTVKGLATIETFKDPDDTVKYLFGDPEGRRFEAVCLTDEGRHTLCISCQIGCRMGCRFCATGKLSYRGDLAPGMIVDQVYRVTQAGTPIQNIVFMGMGEPMDNLKAVLRAIELLNDPNGIHIGQRHITVSTCGLPEGIDAFTQAQLQVRLAISLHAPNDELREELMPINFRYPIDDVLAVVKRYQQQNNRRVTFEYCMIGGVNDATSLAHSLVKRLKGIHAYVNLIEYNAFEGCDYVPSDHKTIQSFAEILRKHGIETVVRFKRGQSIKAACGQLGATWLTPNQT